MDNRTIEHTITPPCKNDGSPPLFKSPPVFKALCAAFITALAAPAYAADDAVKRYSPPRSTPILAKTGAEKAVSAEQDIKVLEESELKGPDLEAWRRQVRKLSGFEGQPRGFIVKPVIAR